MVAQEIVYFKWINNKPVHTISNFYDTEQTMILRRQRYGSRLECLCPTAMKDYNSYIGRVYKANILCSIYGIGHKSKKWWHRIFFGLVSCTLCNAYIVYKKLIEPSIRSLEFHHSIAQSLITLSTQSQMLAGHFLHQVMAQPKSGERCHTAYLIQSDSKILESIM